MIPFLLVLAGGTAVSAIVLVRRAEARRLEGMRTAGARLGWNYRGDVALETLPDLSRFELFTQGRRHTFANLMTSPDGDPRALLFDFSYTTGGGNSQSRHHQTVVYTVSNAVDLPKFSLRPQRFFHTIAKAFGYQDIDLERRPLFSGMFVLRGEDEAAVRDVFDRHVAEFFEAHPDVCAAAIGREVLYWRASRRAGGDEVESLITQALDLTRRLTGRPAR
ncbi:MAG: hypothetical protein KFH98_08075 [Gemmatimonadetes bacterium]|nr:hypothetical protein [Gemmatimonadota bacterium]